MWWTYNQIIMVSCIISSYYYIPTVSHPWQSSTWIRVLLQSMNSSEGLLLVGCSLLHRRGEGCGGGGSFGNTPPSCALGSIFRVSNGFEEGSKRDSTDFFGCSRCYFRIKEDKAQLGIHNGFQSPVVISKPYVWQFMYGSYYYYYHMFLEPPPWLNVYVIVASVRLSGPPQSIVFKKYEAWWDWGAWGGGPRSTWRSARSSTTCERTSISSLWGDGGMGVRELELDDAVTRFWWGPKLCPSFTAVDYGGFETSILGF